MGVNKYNSEGYHDPTVYEALSNIEREVKKKPYRPLIFVCSPFSGEVERNIQKARRFCRYVVDNGAIPIAPHLLYPQFLDDDSKTERNLGIFFGLVLMGKCDAMWVFGSTISKGMRIELTKARSRGLPIRFISEKEVSEYEKLRHQRLE